jgi:peptidyl-prolyl cis-trans isomerase D
LFDTVQKNKRIIQVVLVLIAVPFAFFGLESYTRSMRGADEVARVDGTPITQQEFAEALRVQQDRLRSALGRGFDVSAMDTPEARQALLDSLIAQRLLSAAALAGQLTVSDEVLREAILQIQAFQRDGKFDSATYQQVLRAQGMTEPGFEARLRHDIAVGHLTRAVADTGIASKTVAERIAALEGQRREVVEAIFPAQQFLAQAKVEEAAMRAYYDAHAPQFRTPERVRAEYLVLSAEELGRQEPPTEGELKAAYEARAAQYRVEEQRRASHILLKTKEEAERIAGEARKAPARFAELAKQHSQDTGSAEKGGDLGLFGRGMMVKAFEEAAFGMKEGEISGPVQSEFGWHVIRLTGVKTGAARPFEEVRKELAAEVAKQKGAKKFAEAAEHFGNIVYEQSDSLAPAAERFKLALRRSDWIERAAAPAPLDHAKVRAALFSQDALQGRRNTDAIEVAPNVLVAARVVEHQPAAQRSFDEVKAEIERRLKREQAAKLARARGEAKLAELAGGGDAGLKWPAPRVVTARERDRAPSEAQRRVFAADPAKLPAHVGVDLGEQGYVIVRVLRVLDPEPRDERRKAADAAVAQRNAGAEQFEAWLAGLRQRAKIEINKANLEKK